MKTFTIFLTSLLLLTGVIFAQVSVSTDGSAADPSSMLDVKSNAKGILYPRLTTTERDAISSPANSLMIFNTTTMCLEIYNSLTASWETVHCLSCPIPSAAGTITGSDSVCSNQAGVAYSVPAISWATGYVWTYTGTGFSIASGTNTNSITANFSSATSGNLTVYGTNVCGNGTASPAYNITISTAPAAPMAGTHVPSQTQIIWNWNPVSGAAGYKWNTTNDTSTATDMGISLTKTEQGLTCSNSYTRFVWAYNGCGISPVTTLIQSTAFCCGQSFTDSRDGKTYNTVPLGTQCWMAQNLNVGTRISGSGNQTNNSTIEKYCYADLESNCDTYGGLYQWNEAMQYSITPGVKGICPAGWHLPTDNEWTTLTDYVNNQPPYQCNSTSGWIGKAMASTTLWNSSTNTCAIGNNPSLNNAAGFSILPSGFRVDGGYFFHVGNTGYWWTSTEYDTYFAHTRAFEYINPGVIRTQPNKLFGFSVRCLRDN